MGRRRRIVPDASVMIPAFFPEILDYRNTRFDLSKRAIELRDAVAKRRVEALAPEHLVHEFACAAYRKVSEEGLDDERAKAQLRGFLYLWTQAVRSIALSGLAERAYELSTGTGLPPHDTWYLACAIEHKAELWVSHRHEDRFAELAERVHANVYVLTERRFETRRRAQ